MEREARSEGSSAGSRESRREIAAAYRGRRTKELIEVAEKAVEGRVDAAARFGTTASGNLVLMSIPIAGALYAATRSLGVPRRLRGLTMIALDAGSLYAIGRPKGKRDRDDIVLARWPREGVRVSDIGAAATESAVTFEAPGEPGSFRLFCSSLRTNPWASDLLRALGADPPDLIDPTKLEYDAAD